MRARFLATLLALCLAGVPAHAEPDWKAVAQALGKEGAVQGGGVYRVGLPRSDLKVKLDGVDLKPGFALGSWLAFMPMGNEAMVMGDLVLTGEEVNPVMKKFLENGIEITALHNHLLRAEPPTMYMHVSAHGDPLKLAAAFHDGLALSGTPLGPDPPAAGRIGRSRHRRARRRARLQGKGQWGDLRVFDPARRGRQGRRHDPSRSHGLGHRHQFPGDRRGQGGDHRRLRSASRRRSTRCLRALRANGIEVTAVHNHMLDDEPRLFFMHFWANDDARVLAKGMRAALDNIAVKKN